MPAPAVHLYQIAYSEASRAAIEPGYAVLDNLANPRPDWFEYWPMRQFVQQGGLEDAAFYGLFSPKFGSKTGLSHAQVVQAVQAAAQGQGADVVLFSPQPDMAAFFLNVFEQNELFDPGFMAASEAFLAHIGQPCSLASLVMDMRQTVFSNYFVARPAFWREWLAVGERLFAVCEGLDTSAPASLREALTHQTTYPGAVQRKVFLLERLAPWLLTVQPRWRTHAVNPFNMAWSASRLRERPVDAVISDALKMAYREHGFPQYLDAFAKVRQGLPGAA
ncbi:MAG: hypothetical protein LW854_13315 [Rubrivivax sp.]|jgi:hypothetical protein|nr:hypothetical protein [Rubrivivax sp.]